MWCYIKKMKNYDFGLHITSSKLSFFINLICFDHHISVWKVKVLSTHYMKWILLQMPITLKSKMETKSSQKRRRRKHMSQQCYCPHIKMLNDMTKWQSIFDTKTKHQYWNLGSVSTLTKRIIFFFQKMNSFLKFEIIYFFIVYYNIVMWVVKLFRV
jgi:hypothetical protein